jgi:hypothetical protein
VPENQELKPEFGVIPTPIDDGLDEKTKDRVKERKHLGAELGVGAGADENQIGEEADALVREAEKHGDRSCPITRTIHGRDSQLGQRAYAWTVPERANRTDA